MLNISSVGRVGCTVGLEIGNEAMRFGCGRGRNRGVETAVIPGSPADPVGMAGGEDEASFVRHPKKQEIMIIRKNIY